VSVTPAGSATVASLRIRFTGALSCLCALPRDVCSFMIAGLVVLLHLPQLRAVLAQHAAKCTSMPKRCTCLASILHRIAQQMFVHGRSDGQPFTPGNALRCLQVIMPLRPSMDGYELGQHKDVGEFVSRLIDTLDAHPCWRAKKGGVPFVAAEASGKPVNAANPLTGDGARMPDPVPTAAAFKGSCSEWLHCCKCDAGRPGRTSAIRGILHVSLVDGDKHLLSALARELGSERLDGSDAVLCPKCNAKTETIKTTWVQRRPDVLMLSLKRTQFAGTGAHKFAGAVSIPASLKERDLGVGELQVAAGAAASASAPTDATAGNDVVYELVGVVVHDGSADSGHYFACVKVLDNASAVTADLEPALDSHVVVPGCAAPAHAPVTSWAIINDSTVTVLETPEQQKPMMDSWPAMASLLVYRRVPGACGDGASSGAAPVVASFPGHASAASAGAALLAASHDFASEAREADLCGSIASLAPRDAAAATTLRDASKTAAALAAVLLAGSPSFPAGAAARAASSIGATAADEGAPAAWEPLRTLPPAVHGSWAGGHDVADPLRMVVAGSSPDALSRALQSTLMAAGAGMATVPPAPQAATGAAAAAGAAAGAHSAGDALALPLDTVLNAFDSKLGATRDLVKPNTSYRVQLTREAFRKLAPKCWMEDDVLNFWAEMVKRVYGTRLVARLRLRVALSALGVPPALLPPALLPVVVWSATFYQRLTTGRAYGYHNVKRWPDRHKLALAEAAAVVGAAGAWAPGAPVWPVVAVDKTSGVNPLAAEAILAPVNMDNSHWALVVIRPLRRTIMMMDSLYGPNQTVLANMLRWLVDLEEERGKEAAGAVAGLPWTIAPPPDSLPRQRNGFDCGAFTAMFMLYVILGLQDVMPFTTGDMEVLRQAMGVCMVTNQLPPFYHPEGSHHPRVTCDPAIAAVALAPEDPALACPPGYVPPPPNEEDAAAGAAVAAAAYGPAIPAAAPPAPAAAAAADGDDDDEEAVVVDSDHDDEAVVIDSDHDEE